MPNKALLACNWTRFPVDSFDFDFATCLKQPSRNKLLQRILFKDVTVQ